MDSKNKHFKMVGKGYSAIAYIHVYFTQPTTSHMKEYGTNGMGKHLRSLN